MKFATKLSLGCIALLSCALGAAGLLLTGQSFSGSLASTRTALQAQQEKEKYALERIIFQATDSAQFENYILASAAQQYAEQTADAGSSMALWLDGAYTLYSGLPAALPRTALKQALTNGENAWQLTRAAGRWYLLLTQPLDLPGVRADMLCAYDVSAVFATRDAQLRLVRDGIVICEDAIASLKRFKDDAKEVAAGFECGITLAKFQDIKEGDVFECFKMEEYRD